MPIRPNFVYQCIYKVLIYDHLYNIITPNALCSKLYPISRW